MWARVACVNVLNDTAILPDGRDWFGTFHNTPDGDFNGGTINAVFVDGHVQAVRSGLRTTESPPTSPKRSSGGTKSTLGRMRHRPSDRQPAIRTKSVHGVYAL